MIELPDVRPFSRYNSPQLRWGLIGTGITQQFLDGMRRHSRQIPSVVTSAHPDRARAFADRNSLRSSCDTVEELVARDDVDAVYVASPNEYHLAHALLAIAAGKHVLVEKPIALSGDEAQDIFDAAETQGVLAMEGMWTRYLPQSELIRRVVRCGLIGSVHMVETRFGFVSTPDPQSRLWSQAGGGALLDLGVYGLSFILDVLAAGELQHVSGTQVQGVDARSILTLKARDGGVGTVVSSLSTSIPAHAVISGSEGRLSVDPFFGPSSVTVVRGRFGAEEVATWRESRFEEFHHGLADEVNAFAQYVGQGCLRSEVHPPAQSVAALRIIADARKRISEAHAMRDDQQINVDCRVDHA